MRKWELTVILGLAAFSAMTHLSHPIVLAVLLPVAAIAARYSARRCTGTVVLLLAAAVLAGILPIIALKLMVLIRNPPRSDPAVAPAIAAVIGHAPAVLSAPGTSQVTLKPFLTARLILDGPG